MAVMIPLYLTILLFFRNITQANKTRGPPHVDPLVVSDRRGLCLPRRVPRLRGIRALPRCARTCTVELEGQRIGILPRTRDKHAAKIRGRDVLVICRSPFLAAAGGWNRALKKNPAI